MKAEGWKEFVNRDRERSIKRGGVASITSKLYDTILPTYCPYCEEKGIRNQSTVLGERKYLPDQPVDSDAKDWKQCYLCGKTVHKVHVRPPEGQLISDIDLLDSPYDETSGRIGGIDKRKLGKRGRHEQSKIQLIKDAEVKADLKKSAKLLSYSDTQV